MNAIVTGSFDPITLGHIETIKKASAFFEKLYVVALINKDKEYTFTMEQKKELMRLCLEGMDNVVIDSYDGLTSDYMHKHSLTKIIRGIRNPEDEKYEKKLAEAMRGFDPNFDTVFIKPDEKYACISSSLVRDKLAKGESLSGLVSENAISEMEKMYKENLENKKKSQNNDGLLQS
ncbi:MAG: pantetheine-phosphate adenylyltransferase [Eubacteriales bacterium]